jgi:hypothetical protein
MNKIGFRIAIAAFLACTLASAQDTPAVTDPAEQAVGGEVAPAPENAPVPDAPKEGQVAPAPMPDVPKEVLETPAAIPEVQPELPSVPEPAAPAAAASPFERVFGPMAVHDPAMREQVLAAEHGKRHYVDHNQDGNADEVWFVDTAARHPEEWRPVLVRAIDEDGDLQDDGQPDLDSDLYVVDWRGDGTVDAILDYTDIDDDNDVDEMAMYFPGTPSFGGEGSLVVWWGRDVGDDNLLWFDVGYTYSQPLCQYNSHFGGNEMFCAFVLDPGATVWRPIWENPFLFYDLDGDGVTEEVIRYESEGTSIGAYRHSFDADDDATPKQPRDFDVSITAHAPEGGATVGADTVETIELRGMPTGPFLAYEPGRTAGLLVVWDRMLLTWVEDDNNVDGQRRDDTNERWEGVIANGTDDFPQVGGPSCGPVNRRNELAIQTGAPIQVYFHPVDQRIHLRGAQRAWLDVDADQDHSADMKYTYVDSDGDGAIDTWNLDANADGTVDDTWSAAGADVRDIPWTWADISAVQKDVLATAPQALLSLTQRLELALIAAGSDPNSDPVAQLLRNNLRAPAIDGALRKKLLSSNESMRFYLDILKDRLILQLKGAVPDAPWWPAFYEARGRGDLAAMQSQLEQAYAITDPAPVYVEWAGAKQAEANEGPRVAVLQDWISDHIGWENESIAYRCYWGQIDFYGKIGEGFVLNQLEGDQQAGDWGVDALFVRDTAGSGGVTLFVNGEQYPVWSPQGKGFVNFENSVVEQANDRIVVETRGTNAGPEGSGYTVRLRFTLTAERNDTSVEVLVEGGIPEDVVELGLNLTRLTEQPFYLLDQESGVMAVRGFQSSNVGTIGMGIVYPPARFLRVGDSPGVNQVVLSIERGVPLTYHVQGDWVRGRRFPVAPSHEDWVKELRALAGMAKLE